MGNKKGLFPTILQASLPYTPTKPFSTVPELPPRPGKLTQTLVAVPCISLLPLWRLFRSRLDAEEVLEGTLVEGMAKGLQAGGWLHSGVAGSPLGSRG